MIRTTSQCLFFILVATCGGVILNRALDTVSDYEQLSDIIQSQLLMVSTYVYILAIYYILCEQLKCYNIDNPNTGKYLYVVSGDESPIYPIHL